MLRHSIVSVGDELMDGHKATAEGAAPAGAAAAGVEVLAAATQGIAVAAIAAVGKEKKEWVCKCQVPENDPTLPKKFKRCSR